MTKRSKPIISKKSVELLREGMKKNKDKFTAENILALFREEAQDEC